MILGLDIGGTKIAAVLGNREGKISWKQQFQTNPQRGFHTVFEDLVNATKNGIENSEDNIEAISVSIGGPIDVLKGVIKSPPNLPGWDNIPLKQLLEKRFSLPVYIEHDGNAGALAEFFFGAGKGFNNIVFITMGTGFGAGLILDGRLYRGTTDAAGEIGHIRVAEDGPLSYNKAGSLEGYGSGNGIVLLAHQMYPNVWPSTSTAATLYEAFKGGSSEAREVFEKAAYYLGRGFAMLADLLNPERIILGGLGMRIGDAFLPTARRVFHEEALAQTASACEIVPAQLGETIGDVASLCAAIDQGRKPDGQPETF